MAKNRVRDMFVRQRMRTYTAKQFHPRTQGEDDWPVGVRRSQLDDRGAEPFVIGKGNDQVAVHNKDWVLTDHAGVTIVCRAEDFDHDYEEVPHD